MSHEFESGFFTRQPAWHNLGNVLPEPPASTHEAMLQAGLDWRVNVNPLFANLPNEEWLPTGFNAIIRDSDTKVMGICKDRWTPYQNEDAFAWSLPLIESGEFEYEAAGSLKGGRNCWILLRHGDVEIVENDKLRQYLMVMWSHDGKTANIVQPTSIRVVCNNTLQQALNEKGITRLAVNHSQFVSLNMETTKEILGVANSSFENQVAEFRKLASKTLTKEKQGFLLNEIFPEVTEEGKAQTINIQNRKMIEELVQNGSGIKEHGLEGTAFAFYQGVSEAVEHFLGGNRIKDRGANILFGKGREILDKTFALVTAP